jgi:hypothetical protein
VVDVTLIVMEDDADLARTRALVDRLWDLEDRPISLSCRRRPD